MIDSLKDKDIVAEIGAIKAWFEVISEGEKGSAMLTFLGQCHPSHLWFFKATIQAYMESILTRH